VESKTVVGVGASKPVRVMRDPVTTISSIESAAPACGATWPHVALIGPRNSNAASIPRVNL
jgi:hypothetical protein